MSREVLLAGLVGILVFCSLALGDFKYTQTSQITGGAMAGMMKGMGVFSKSMRQATKPSETTTYVKGGYLRRDNADGTYQVIDLDGQRIVDVNPGSQTYSVTTFEQMRQMVGQMTQRMHEGVQTQEQQQNVKIKMTPKVQVTPTGKTQSILGQDTQELIVKLDLEMEATDAQQGTQSGAISTQMDEWIAPSIGGYREVSEFYRRMATEVGWTPGSVGVDPRMTSSLVQLYKSGKIPVGLPMFSTLSMVPEGGSQPSPQQQGNQQDQQSSGSSGNVASPQSAAATVLGGIFHRRKKQQADEDQQNGTEPQSSAPSNSLMTITTRISSFSTDSIDASLFQIPSGFSQVQSKMEQRMQSTSH